MSERIVRTQVGIVGAGPAGLWLAHLLAVAGIDSVVLEKRPRAEIAATHRAGILEQGTVDLMTALGLDARMRAEGYAHHGIELRVAGQARRIDFADLVGRAVQLYPQQEVFSDLADGAAAKGLDVRFEVADVALHDLTGESPSITFTDADGTPTRVVCDFVAGCDGSRGISKRAIPEVLRTDHFREYPFGWFGILVEAEPSAPELIYANSDHGFALISQRTATTQRMYFQCDPTDSPDNWDDERIWDQLDACTAAPGFTLRRGPIFDKTVIPMRSYVCEPLQYGRLFLAGDAGHTVPPTGAKGMNLAAGDVSVLARSLERYYREGEADLLETYTATALSRVWKAQHFSWWMTSMLHTQPGASTFDRRRQLGELDLVTTSRAGSTYLAEAYTGWPLIPTRPGFLDPDTALGNVLASQLTGRETTASRP
ncbi:4-hydroxybenzoate 3-monooxygenase [Georgenia thermotolerans]|uniref:4-hydroxybenzoate 3-monooxygenase n=1 Tax=Georgenia thermotolerans TaxID=527326 RepID=A0A7J5UT95_9MICO|nr:4-hydroxybenzoate 3-monooxygenase [Georgenia thermotolerans]KAE8765333.1 4-hydroxybenzoate 3-monooxygenase [Georgenia thermotolerans]